MPFFGRFTACLTRDDFLRRSRGLTEKKPLQAVRPGLVSSTAVALLDGKLRARRRGIAADAGRPLPEARMPFERHPSTLSIARQARSSTARVSVVPQSVPFPANRTAGRSTRRLVGCRTAPRNRHPRRRWTWSRRGRPSVGPARPHFPRPTRHRAEATTNLPSRAKASSSCSCCIWIFRRLPFMSSRTYLATPFTPFITGDRSGLRRAASIV